ncbi:MAG: CPBP family intramembrane metalloprotease [Cryobacterium sp.]|nr:CPBP family intramembrane metalloprotease [Cryobacterium sp.]
MSTQQTASAIALPLVRIALVVLAALATAGILALAGQPFGPEAVSTFGAIYLLPVNILSLMLVGRLLKREGSTIRAAIGFDRSRLGRDIGWGSIWLMVLFVPFVAAIMGTMFALHGGDMFERFETVFAPDVSQVPTLGLAGSLVFAIVAVVTFAPLNAPAEELVYRGYSQGRLAPHHPVVAVLVPSALFGIQHIAFAATPTGMLVYAVAFFAWGLGSALIYRWQRRLMPLIIAHLIVNLGTSLPALILPFVLN